MSNPNQPYPEASVEEISPGAAFAQTGIPDVVVIAGPSSKGPLNAPRLLTDIATLVATFGTGDAVKKAAYLLARVAAAVVFLRMTTANVAGVLGAVVAVLNGSSTITSHVLSGTPTSGADVVILFGAVGGNTGTGPIAYQVSTDGGNTYGATQALGSGLTITVLGVTLTLITNKVVTAGDTLAWLQTVASSTVLPVNTSGVTGSSAITVTTTATLVDAYEVAWKCVDDGNGGAGFTIGAAGVSAKYEYTLDYLAPSPTWFPAAFLGTANTLALIDGPNSTEPSGLTLNFGAGTVKTGDLVAFGTSAPAYDSAGVIAASNALLANSAPGWAWLYFAGPVAEALAASVATTVAGWSTTYKPSWGVVDGRDRAQTETLAAWSARFDAEYVPYTSTRVGVSKGKARGLCPITGRNNRRDAMMFCLARAMGAKGATIATDWGEYDLGPLDPDVSITDVNLVQVEYDSFKDQNGVTMGAIALRTWPGVSGIFPATASLMGPDGDVKLVPIRRVFNVAQILALQVGRLPVCKAFRQWKLGATPSAYAVGDVYEPDARNIERIGQGVMTAGIFNRGWCSAISYTIKRTPISLGGGNWRLQEVLQVTPLIYVKQSDATAQLVSASTPTG